LGEEERGLRDRQVPRDAKIEADNLLTALRSTAFHAVRNEYSPIYGHEVRTTRSVAPK
jgi:hypothetical protein